jgi:hypothetical protein
MKIRSLNPIIVCLLLVISARICPGQGTGMPVKTDRPEVIFNQKINEGLYSRLDLNDPVIVFNTVFSALDTDVMVYPTENYYYFQIFTFGKTIWGNLRLDASDRDLGIIHLGYFQYDENGVQQDRDGNGKEFSYSDGVIVSRIDSLNYSVQYIGKTVRFHLNDLSKEAPRRAGLSKNEIYVGPIFDESGLRFFLLYNHKEKHFMYILNEEANVPENFDTIDSQLLRGTRTAFLFYEDTLFNRKILLAVNGRSTDRNNYYDGPFDQLPDNFAKNTHISQFIQKAYPYTKGNVDQFGGFKDQEEARVVIFPYSVYYDEEEIIELLSSAKESGLPVEEFFTRITPDPYSMIGKE